MLIGITLSSCKRYDYNQSHTITRENETKIQHSENQTKEEIRNTYQKFISKSEMKKINLIPIEISPQRTIFNPFLYYTEKEYQNNKIERKNTISSRYYQNPYNNNYPELINDERNFYNSPNPKSKIVDQTETYYFYPLTTQDFSKIEWQKEKIISKIIQEKYGVSQSINDLIFSKNYSNEKLTEIDINSFTSQLLELTLQEAKQMLKYDRYREAVEKLKISYKSISQNKDHSKDLWVEISNNKIFISPKLVRAAFIYSISLKIEIFHTVYFPNNNFPSAKYLTYDDVKGLNDIFIQDFKNSFYFIFIHEMAHEYLNRPSIGEIDVELLCDKEAFNAIKESKGHIEYGVFSTILHESIKAGMPEIWGENFNGKDILTRINELDKLNETPEK